MRPLPLLAILLLLAGCVGQGNGARDTDGDGLPDDQETTPHAISIAYANGTVESRAVTSDPHRQDTDGDGLSDVDEFAFKTDPRSVDTDRDGLLDGHNVTLPAGSDQAKAWRALGVLEVPAGSGKFVGEMDATRECTLSAARGSSELLSPDALSDGAEVAGWNVTVRGFSFPVTSDPCVADTDRDGLPDDKEMALGTDPRNPDTDGDGVVDGFDADPLWNLGLALENVTASGNATVSFQAGAQAVEFPATGTAPRRWTSTTRRPTARRSPSPWSWARGIPKAPTAWTSSATPAGRTSPWTSSRAPPRSSTRPPRRRTTWRRAGPTARSPSTGASRGREPWRASRCAPEPPSRRLFSRRRSGAPPSA